MDQQPSFSVVIPTYNREGLIVKTLDTVLGQTYTQYEVIVVDNCSTDNTEKVLEPYIQSGKIRFIKHDRNYERAASRNTGMEHATGDFVTFLDSDDLMYPQNLQDAAGYVLAHPQVKLFHNRYELVDPENRVLHRYRLPSLADPLRAIAEGNFLSCIGVFVHREVYQRYRFDTNPLLTGSEDWDFWVRVVADYWPGRINKVNSGIVHHGGRTVTNIDLPRLRQRIQYTIAKVIADPHLHAVYKSYLKRMELSALVYMASVANSGRKYQEARQLLWEAFTRDFRVAVSYRFIRALQIATLRIEKS
jgi:glycosyltransferase involved in cell wall biosynthesis